MVVCPFQTSLPGTGRVHSLLGAEAGAGMRTTTGGSGFALTPIRWFVKVLKVSKSQVSARLVTVTFDALESALPSLSVNFHLRLGS